jgi:hypothetical protein
MRLAGLEPAPVRQTTAATGGTVDRPASGAVSVPDAIGLYLESHGHLLSRNDLQWFRDAGKLMMANKTGRPWREFVAMFREQWTAKGRWAPPGLYRQRQPLPLAGRPGLPRHTYVTEERYVEAVAAFWDELPARLEPTQKRYGA